MPGFSRLDSVLEAIRARSTRNRLAAAGRTSPRLCAPIAEMLERRQLLSVSSIQVQAQGQPVAGMSWSGQVASFQDDAGSASDPDDFAVSLTVAGTSTTASLANDGQGNYQVYTSETFPWAGSYTITADLTETNPDGSTTDISDSASVGVADATLQPLAPESVSLAAGQSFSGEIAEFLDPAGTYDPTLFAPPTIDFGDGNTGTGSLQPLGGGSYAVIASYTYALPGSFSGGISINENPPSGGDASLGASVSLGFTADVAAALSAGTPETIYPVQGQSFSGEVGVVIDSAGAGSNPSDLSATISWGDGNSSSANLVPLGNGSYSIQGTNVYQNANGSYGSVQVIDELGGGTSLSFQADVTTYASAPPLDADSPETINATEGQSFSGEVGVVFDEAGASSNPSNLSATINFGDGNSSAATLVPINSGSYSIQGSNTYAEPGRYAGSIIADDANGSSASLSFTADVAAAPLDPGGPETIDAVQNRTFSGEVGTMVDTAGAYSNPSDLSATIYWGDGKDSAATLVPLGGGNYSVQGTNVYGSAGTFSGSIQVFDHAGSSSSSSLGMSFSASVSGASYAPLDPGSPEAIYSAEGQTFSGAVGLVFDEAGDNSNLANLSGTISWGNGDVSNATLVPINGNSGSYSVQGTEVYT
jgi:hypothetical protein